MNHLLRQVAKDLRYRPLPNLVSRRVHLDRFDSVVQSVSSWLEKQLPHQVAFEGPEAMYRSFAVVKYGILDLTFSVEQIDWIRDDLRGLPLLKELGFVMRPDEVSDALVGEVEDPTCLTDLKEDIDKKQTLLRLFLEKRPGQLGDPVYLKHMVLSGEWQEILRAMEAGGEDFKRVVDDCFPADFVVSDACLTNAAFVWFHKHLYL